MKKWSMWWTAGFLILFSLPGCTSPVYFAESMEAWVVDAETGEPVEGVVVVANWQLKDPGLDGSKPRGSLMILETVTDKNGRFHFPAWGPKLAVRLRFGSEDPILLFFKSGYFPSVESNNATTEPNPSMIRRSESNGKKIPLEKHRGNWEKYLDRHDSLAGNLSFLTLYAEDCEWKAIPRMLVAIEREKQFLDQKNIKGTYRMSRIGGISSSAKCGSAEQFFRGYFK